MEVAANHYGIDCYTSLSTFEGNQIRNIGLIENLNRSGMGCGFTGTNCTENGAGFRLKLHDSATSAHGNTIRFNVIERVGLQGFDIFGPDKFFRKNTIREACWSKGDCGGVYARYFQVRQKYPDPFEDDIKHSPENMKNILISCFNNRSSEINQ